MRQARNMWLWRNIRSKTPRHPHPCQWALLCTRDPENPRVEKELRVSKKGAGGDTREGNFTRNHS